MTWLSELAYHLVQIQFISYNMLYVKENIETHGSLLVMCGSNKPRPIKPAPSLIQ